MLAHTLQKFNGNYATEKGDIWSILNQFLYYMFVLCGPQ